VRVTALIVVDEGMASPCCEGKGRYVLASQDLARALQALAQVVTSHEKSVVALTYPCCGLVADKGLGKGC